ncbi:MAG: hypothetical protein ACOX2S_10300 [bacterium]
MQKNKVRRLLEAGTPAFGTFNWLTGPECIEILGAAGVRFRGNRHGTRTPWPG